MHGLQEAVLGGISFASLVYVMFYCREFILAMALSRMNCCLGRKLRRILTSCLESQLLAIGSTPHHVINPD